MNNIQPVQKMPFKLYPLNKSSSGVYNSENGSPYITFQFAENNMRVLKSDCMYLCGRLRIYNKNKKNCPANRFDLAGTAAATTDSYEEVCYMDDRVGCNSVIDQIDIQDLRGSLLEQAPQYNRHMSAIIGATNSYRHLCSFSNLHYTACVNNDVQAREVCSDIEFSLPLMCGYFLSNANIPMVRGLELKLRLASAIDALFGKDAQNYTFACHDVYLMGDYLMLAKPIKDEPMSYVSTREYVKPLNSGNDHQNINLALSMVNKITQTFLPAAWEQSYSHSAFSTCPLLNYTGTDYEVAKLKRYNINRGSIRFPLYYAIDETNANKNDVYQTIRSREYLNSIVPYDKISSSLISPDTEKRSEMVMARTNWLKTPQSTDQGLTPSWVKSNSGEWSRTGDVEKAANCFGIGTNYDQLFVRSFTDFSNASYNWNLESEVDNTTNNCTVFCTAVTKLQGAGSKGQIVATT